MKIASEERAVILEAERMAGAYGVLPDEKDKRKVIVERLRRRLAQANLGWGFKQDETVVRVDDYGVARVIPKTQAVGWLRGLPAHRDTVDLTSNQATPGRTKPYEKEIAFNDPGPITVVDPRVAAQRFYQRIRTAMETTGTIPVSLKQDLQTEGWKLGQPVPQGKLEEWCSKFQQEYWNKHGRS